jgi:quercetin 2,3-dioxygenase
MHQAVYRPIDDLITHSPLPTHQLRQVDPFLFLNHHGPQVYKANNHGLPFGPHPHRGMETVTFIIEGDIMHQDSANHLSIIQAGGIQWVTAGSGLIHAEISSEQFRKKGGNLEILQLWINLPAKLKMTAPYYKGFQKEEIPIATEDNGKITIQVIAGQWKDTEGAHTPLSDLHLHTIWFQKESKLSLSIPVERNIFFYIVKGKLSVNGLTAEKLHLIEFNNDETGLEINAPEDSILIFGHAIPFNEPLVTQGPFVMNTEEEIVQAYQDYQSGKFGQWNL